MCTPQKVTQHTLIRPLSPVGPSCRTIPFYAGAGYVPVRRNILDKALLQLAADLQGAGLAIGDQLLLLRCPGRALPLPHVLPREWRRRRKEGSRQQTVRVQQVRYIGKTALQGTKCCCFSHELST